MKPFLPPPKACFITCLSILLFPIPDFSRPPKPCQFTWIYTLLPWLPVSTLSFASCQLSLPVVVYTSVHLFWLLRLVFIALNFRAISFDIFSVFLFIWNACFISAVDCSLLLSPPKESYSSHGSIHLCHHFLPLTPHLLPVNVLIFIFTLSLGVFPHL